MPGTWSLLTLCLLALLQSGRSLATGPYQSGDPSVLIPPHSLLVGPGLAAVVAGCLSGCLLAGIGRNPVCLSTCRTHTDLGLDLAQSKSTQKNHHAQVESHPAQT